MVCLGLPGVARAQEAPERTITSIEFTGLVRTDLVYVTDIVRVQVGDGF